ncbi:SxtJ family membrane protein [Luminiphilus sp.]|nr:SxtJ family membrane protein [Luminiphilus sp.]
MKINYDEIQLPTNKKFGLFFSFVFFILATYFFSKNNQSLSLVFFVFANALLILAHFKPNMLLPLNKAWMRLGFLLGKVVSPLVLGVLFFGLFTPIALVMKVVRRDELRLKFAKKSSYWKPRVDNIEPASFKNQF